MNLPAITPHSPRIPNGGGSCSGQGRGLLIPYEATEQSHDSPLIGDTPLFSQTDGETRGGTMKSHGTGAERGAREQRRMPMVSPIGAPRLLDTYLVDTCKSGTQAIALTARYGGFKDRDLAEMLDCAPGTLSKYLTGGGANPSLDRLADLMHVCRNLGALQYLARRMNCDVVARETIDTESDESTDESERREVCR